MANNKVRKLPIQRVFGGNFLLLPVKWRIMGKGLASLFGKKDQKIKN
jgi:hypothetical protein